MVAEVISYMEPSIRGLIEQSIDAVLSDASMQLLHIGFESLRPLVKSREDAILGYIFGNIISLISSYYTMLLRRTLTANEMSEMSRVLNDRLPLIKSRIAQTFT